MHHRAKVGPATGYTRAIQSGVPVRVTNAERVVEFLRSNPGSHYCDACIAKGITASGRDAKPPLPPRDKPSVQPITKVLECCPGFARGACKNGHPERAVSYAGCNQSGLHRRVYAVDVGTTLPQRPDGTPHFAWASVDPEVPEVIVGSSSVELLGTWLVKDLRARRSVALGFEAPLFIPVPTAASNLCRGRYNEGSPSWSAPPGLTVASLGLHQAAWILRWIADHCGGSVDFQVAPTAWPPDPGAGMLFCWEAFVSGAVHSESHIQDAATAAEAFLLHERNLADATTVTGEHPLSLIGAAALWSGLAVSPEILRTATVVLRPARRCDREIEILETAVASL